MHAVLITVKAQAGAKLHTPKNIHYDLLGALCRQLSEI